MTVRAVYKNGVFRPTEPVDLPEDAEVEVVLPANFSARSSDVDAGSEAVYAILNERYRSGRHDVAERHNEHQP